MEARLRLKALREEVDSLCDSVGCAVDGTGRKAGGSDARGPERSEGLTAALPRLGNILRLDISFKEVALYRGLPAVLCCLLRDAKERCQKDKPEAVASEGAEAAKGAEGAERARHGWWLRDELVYDCVAALESLVDGSGAAQGAVRQAGGMAVLVDVVLEAAAGEPEGKSATADGDSGKEGPEDEEDSVEWCAVSGLCHMTELAANEAEFCSRGGVEALAKVAAGEARGDVPMVLSALTRVMARKQPNKKAGVKAGLVEVAIEALISGAKATAAPYAQMLCALMKGHGEAAKRAVEAGVIPAAMRLASEGDVYEAAEALRLLALLPSSGAVSTKLIDAGCVPILVNIVRKQDETSAEACAALAKLAGGNKACKDAILQTGGIQALSQVLRAESCSGAHARAAVAIANLATTPEVRDAVIAAEGVEPLVAMVKNGTNEQIDAAAGALRSVATSHPKGSDAIIHYNGPHVLIQMMKRVSVGKTQAKAAAALKQMALDVPYTRIAVIASGALEALLEVARSGGNEARLKALDAVNAIVIDNASAVEMSRASGPTIIVRNMQGTWMDIKPIACHLILKLTLTNETNRSLLGGYDLAPHLAELLRSTSNPDVRADAACVCQMVTRGRTDRTLYYSNGFVELYMELLRPGTKKTGNARARQAAAGGLANMFDYDIGSDAIVGKWAANTVKSGCLPLLVSIIRNADEEEALRGECAAALWNIMVRHPQSTQPTVLLGAVAPLVSMVTTTSGDAQISAVGALWAISSDVDGRAGILKCEGGVKALLDVAATEGEEPRLFYAKNEAIAALWHLAGGGAECEAALHSAGAVDVLTSVTQHGTPQQVNESLSALYFLLDPEKFKELESTVKLTQDVEDGADSKEDAAEAAEKARVEALTLALAQGTI